MRNFRLVLLACCMTAGCAGVVLAQSQAPSDPAFQEEFAKAKQALSTHKYDNAISSFKKANKLHQNQCADCYYGMALASWHTSDLDHALENADKALAFADDDVSRAIIRNLKGNIFLTVARREPKKLKNAEEEYRLATQFDRGRPEYHLNLARALLLQSKDEDAKPELRACLEDKPDADTAREAALMLADPRKGRQEIAPEFKFTTLQGADLSLTAMSGKVLVMDFWATWCPPCRESVPELKALTRKYPTDKLILVSVSADKDETAWREFVTRKSMDWAQYRDSDHKVLDTFGIHAFPTYLVITGDGIIKQRIVGMNPQESIVHRLKETLASMPELEGTASK
jgi:thiol-disulfide isomerase/thioredoxin